MQNFRVGLLFILFAFIVASCSDSDDVITPSNSGQPSVERTWSIPTNEVLQGATRDAIPAIDNPIFEPVSGATLIADNDLVIGVKIGDEARAYPHFIMDWHEIVNDQIDENFFALTYCPLTGTAIGWNRQIDGVVNNFGVSGFLYNSNLMPYDRVTNSIWSQMRLDCVNGELLDRTIETVFVTETSWKTWKSMFPNSVVLSTQTGFTRNYNGTAYPGYSTSSGLIFPVNNTNDALHSKERVLGVVVNNFAKAYPISELSSNGTSIIQEVIGGTEIVVVGSQSQNFIAAFESNFNGTRLSFSSLETRSDSAVMTDNLGNNWNIFGQAVSGPNEGAQLKPLEESYIGYWFSWAAFHPNIDLYTN